MVLEDSRIILRTEPVKDLIRLLCHSNILNIRGVRMKAVDGFLNVVNWSELVRAIFEAGNATGRYEVCRRLSS